MTPTGTFTERPRLRGAPVRSLALALFASAALPAACGSAPSGSVDQPLEGSSAAVTDFGAVGDGVTDDTEAFEAAAATGQTLRVPKPPVHYKLTRKVRVRASVIGEESAEIRMYGANGQETHAIFEVSDYRGPGLVIRGLRLDGQWNGIAADGEWSHLIVIKGSRNVTVEGNVLVRPYGDCILIGGEGNPNPSENVVIRDNRMERPRRCAIAVIAARKVFIHGNDIRKTSGYVAAIDLEPNPNGVDAVHDVEIAGNRFEVRGVAILLHTKHPSPPSGRVTIRGNTATASPFVQKRAGTGVWRQITVSENTYLGGGAAGTKSFARIVDASDVTIAANRIAAAGAGGGDELREIRGLRLTDNVWSGIGSYAVNVVACPEAHITGNQFPGIGVVVRP